jgi:glycine cleavage system H protein
VQIPEDLRYTENHEWVRMEPDGTVTIGITDYAQDALGDVVFVDLPEVGRATEAGEVFAEVESTKSVNDVYAPVAGTVASANALLVDAPETINDDPYGEGWFVKLEPSGDVHLDELMDGDAYRGFTED